VAEENSGNIVRACCSIRVVLPITFGPRDLATLSRGVPGLKPTSSIGRLLGSVGQILAISGLSLAIVGFLLGQSPSGSFRLTAEAKEQSFAQQSVVRSSLPGTFSRRLGTSAANPLHVMAATESSQFANPVTYDTGGVGPGGALVGDMNGDGKPDLVVVNACDGSSNCDGGTVSVLFGNGDGTFQTAIAYDAGYLPNLLAVADVNGDGKPDLIVGNQCASRGGNSCIAVLLGNGDGTFHTAKIAYGPANQPLVSLAAADVNRDGKPDLIVVNGCGNGGTLCSNDKQVGVLLGNGDGSFQTLVTYGTGANAGLGTTSVTVADVNGDGSPDLLVTSNCGAPVGCNPDGYPGVVSVLLGNGDGSFQAAVTYASGSGNPNAAAVGDLNGDDKLDLVVSNACEFFIYCGGDNGQLHGVVGVLPGNGNGTFKDTASYDAGGFGTASVTLGDVNGDGKLDVAIASNCASNDFLCMQGTAGVVGVLLGNGDGTFQPVATYGSGGYQAHSIVAADVNGDGRPDLIAANCGDNPSCTGDGTVAVLLNTSISFGLVASPDTVTISAPGQSGSTTLSIHANGSLNPQSLANWTCSGLPSQSSCSFGTVSDKDQIGLTINTTAAGDLRRPVLRREMFYACLFPGCFSLMFVAGRKRASRGWRPLALLGILSLLAWWVACGGGSGSGSNGGAGGGGGNQGTSSGTYAITVSATSGSLKPTTTITLKVK